MRLKGAEKRKQQSTRNNTPAATGEDITMASSIMQLQEDMEKLQKESVQNANEQQKQISALTTKNNNMQTQYENAKQATTLSQKKAKEHLDIKAEKMAQIVVIQNTVQEKEQDLHCNKMTMI